MATINFNKLNCKIDTTEATLQWGDNAIEVKQYLPIQEKLRLMEEVIGLSVTAYNYANPVQVEVYTRILILKYYTNIKFTDKQLSEPAKLYDAICSSGLLDAVCKSIPEKDLTALYEGVEKSVTAFYAYRTSLLGILDALKTDYSDLNAQLSTVLGQINDPEALKLIKLFGAFQGANSANITE